MKVFVFGNIDVEMDNRPLHFLPQLKKDFSELEFIEVKPNEDLPIGVENESVGTVYILDTVDGISEPKIMDETAIDRLSCTANSSVHDYDLGFQLKYLKKLGKIKSVKILGLPMKKEISYSSFHSIFKKFVAQDIQGS